MESKKGVIKARKLRIMSSSKFAFSAILDDCLTTHSSNNNNDNIRVCVYIRHF